MDVESNYRNGDNNEPSFSASSVTNDTFSKLLKKHDFNAIVEMLKLDSQKSDNTSNTRKESFNSKSKDSTSTFGEAFRTNAGENLKECSVKHNNSVLSDHSVINSDVNVGKHSSDHSKNTVQPKYSFSSCKSHHYDSTFSYSKNTENLNNYLAEYRNRVIFENEEQVHSPREKNFPHTSCAEKTTYCRPVHNVYNKEFVNKTIEKNIKLQKLLKKIVLARKREKEREKWNNYLNELKNKHSYYSNEPRHISPQYVPRESLYPGPMYDLYNTKYYWNAPRPLGSLVQAVYGYNDTPAPPHEYYSSNYERVCENPRLNHLYQNEQYCFPTSSQGRFMMMQKDKMHSNMPYHTQSHNLDTPIVIDKEKNYKKTHSNPKPHKSPTLKIVDKEINLKKTRSIIKRNNFKTKVSTMLEDCGCSPIGEINLFFKEKPEPTIGETSGQRVETTKEKYDRVTENVNRLKQKIDNTEQKMQRKSSTSLKTIETKLDALMTSLNNFMTEMKSKKDSTSPSLTPIDSIDSSDNSRESSLPPRDSSCFGTKKKSVTIVGNATTSTGILQSIPFANGILRHAAANTKINNILDEERDKSNKLRREIEELLPTQTNRPCVQITFDIPTKERATEVTHSLSKTKLSNRDTKVNEVIEDLIAPNRHRKMTIAVNTDPLGLLALFRISSEAIKQLMSYVDYNWYFSRLPLRQVEKSGVSDYVCNICGDAFARPSQLSDHIKRHKLGNAKDCCVCRHALDTKRCCSSLFGCQYCGQVFTRAYCCELHQQTCARRFGRKHDVSSSLVMLS